MKLDAKVPWTPTVFGIVGKKKENKEIMGKWYVRGNTIFLLNLFHF